MNIEKKTFFAGGVFGFFAFLVGALADMGDAATNISVAFERLKNTFLDDRPVDTAGSSVDVPAASSTGLGGLLLPPKPAWKRVFKEGWVYYENGKNGQLGVDTKFGVNGVWQQLPDYIDLRVSDYLVASDMTSVRVKPGSNLRKVATLRPYECVMIIDRPDDQYEVEVNYAQSGGWVLVRHVECPDRFNLPV